MMYLRDCLLFSSGVSGVKKKTDTMRMRSLCVFMVQLRVSRQLFTFLIKSLHRLFTFIDQQDDATNRKSIFKYLFSCGLAKIQIGISWEILFLLRLRESNNSNRTLLCHAPLLVTIGCKYKHAFIPFFTKHISPKINKSSKKVS